MKHSLLISLLMFVCLGVFGKSSSVPPKEVTLNTLQTTIDSQQSTITTLQDSIWNQQMQINNLKEKVDTYQKLVSDTTNNIHDDMDDWLVILSIVITVIVALLGVVVPLIINYRNEKHLEKMLENTNVNANNAIRQAEDAQSKLTRAQSDLESIQNNIDKAKNQATDAAVEATSAKNSLIEIGIKVDKTANDAKNAAKKAKAIQYFVQALQESDETRAIKLYDKCIDEDKEFAEAYNNRGFLRHKKGDAVSLGAALKDFTTAITLFENQGRGIYAEAYNNRGILHYENKEMYKAKEDLNAAISLNYAESYLNRGLLNYQRDNLYDAMIDFGNAIANKSNFAEAYYIRGLWKYCYEMDSAIKDIVNAKAIKNDVIEAYPNRCLLSGKMKEMDNSFNGVEYSLDMKKLIRVPKDKKDPFIIPSSVTEIGESAFAGCTSLTSIVIPDKVTKIGSHSFNNCINLTSIVIPESVTIIEGFPLPVSSIKIPESVTGIEDLAFIDYTKHNPIKIPNLMLLINESIFVGCTSLIEIHLKHTAPIDFSYAFRDLDISKIKLYVPKGSGEAYLKLAFYKGFKVVIEE